MRLGVVLRVLSLISLIVSLFMIFPLALAVCDGAAGRLAFFASLAVGPLSFIGLMTPHLARRSGAVSIDKQLPVAALYGAALMLVADWLGRYLIFPYEIGAGTIAGILGGGYFLFLLRENRS